MDRFWRSEPQWIILWLALLAALVALAYYVLGKIRPKPSQKEPTTEEWLSKFQELRDRGELTDEEFREIKTTLASQLQDELNGNDRKG